jgi:hypothetical protein
MGIKTSCNHKIQLYLLCKDSNDIKLKQYCKLLSRVITEAKRSKYNKQIINFKGVGCILLHYNNR